MSEPACWSWPVPPLRGRDEQIAYLLQAQEGLSIDQTCDPAAFERLCSDMARVRFTEFHTGVRGLYGLARCAVCDLRGPTVEDHCHRTGQVRGLLCHGCNVAEGRSREPVFQAYRRRHPAAILGHYEPYTGRGWEMGWSVMEVGDPYALGPRPATPWS